jgi:hypothetical protein
LYSTSPQYSNTTLELLGSLDEEEPAELLLPSEDDELPFGTPLELLGSPDEEEPAELLLDATLELLGSLDEEKSMALESISSSLGNLSGG